MQTHRNKLMTPEDTRLLSEALMLLFAVKMAARAEQDAKMIETLGDRLFREEEHDGQPEIAGGV